MPTHQPTQNLSSHPTLTIELSKQKAVDKNLSENGKNVGNATVTYPDLATVQDVVASVFAENCSRLDRLHRKTASNSPETQNTIFKPNDTTMCRK